LHAAEALVTAGKTRAAADLARAAVAAAGALAHRPTLALALLTEGIAVAKSGDWRGAEGLYGDALVAGASVGDARVAAAAATNLAVLFVSLEPRFDDARRYARLALAFAEHAGLERPIVDAEYALGEVELVAGRLEESQRHFEAALARAETTIG